jgi:hypothetical protein
MESQRITILLQKYFEAETTLEEENELITYFTSGEVDEDLKIYIPMFSGIRNISVEENADLSDELMDYILESEHKEKVKYRWMWKMVTGIAASVIVVMLSVNYYNSRTQWKDTFTDPEKAYAEASKTLDFVAGKYNQGLAQLRPIGKIESAVNPFNSGMKKLNKGFDQMNELNKKLKEE